MIRFSKVWCGFTAAAMNLVTIFMAGIVRWSSAQTTQDSVVKKDKPSSDTTKGTGLLGIGGIIESLNSNSGLLTLIVTSAGVIISYLLYRSRRLDSPDPDVSGTSAGLAKALENRRSKEYLWYEKEMRDAEQNPDPVVRARARAYRLQEEGKINDAIQEWRNIAKIAKEENNYLAAHAWFSIGYLYDMEDQGEEAFSAYSEAINLDENYAVAYFKRGNRRQKFGTCELDQGNTESAFEHYEFAIADYSDAILVKRNFADAYLGRGSVKFTMNQYEAAGVDYSDAIRFKPKLVGAYSGRAEVDRHFKRYELAIANYNKAIRLELSDPRLYNNRGGVKTAFGQHEFNRKDMLSAHNQYESALSDFNKAIVLNPDLANPYFNRGNLKQMLADYESAHANTESARNQYESALLDYTEAIRLDPNLILPYSARGALRVDLGKVREEREDFQTALELARAQNQTELETEMEARILRLDNRR